MRNHRKLRAGKHVDEGEQEWHHHGGGAVLGYGVFRPVEFLVIGELLSIELGHRVDLA